ncbi:hypothetical protein [Allokutzneria albata]|uniref:Signal transduction histidine kinase n=1 Tax=Allokutzneria albata TaxID=211114 RepID=A0A1H0DM39_ALLAB|nr:hypothetical protein [Allokutzneria albata]SDN71214.1 hypothetical protein SAMN04489726_7885 [Allokutzneria albata]
MLDVAAPAPPATAVLKDTAPEPTTAHILRGLRLAVVAITLAVLCGLSLPMLLVHMDLYQPAWVQIAAFTAFVLIACGFGALAWLEITPGRWRWPLAVVVFLISIAATAAVPAPHLIGQAHWSFGPLGWLAVLLTLDLGARPLAALLVTHYVVTLVQLAVAGQTDRATLVGMAVQTVIVWGFQLAVGHAATLMRRIAVDAARVAEQEEKLRTDEAVAERLHAEQRLRYTALATTTAPLLAGLATGALNPEDERVRRSCALEAARMRRLFAEGDDVPDPLVHQLQACIDLVERNGITVSLAVRGERPVLSRRVRRALTEPVLAVLVATTRSARVTVAGWPDRVSVSVVSDMAPAELPTVECPGVATTTMEAEGRVWVEVTWRA